MQMEQALKLLFGGGAAKEEKGDEKDEAGSSSTSNVDSKIVLGKRKRNNKPNSNSAMTLENKDSNVSIEVKLNGLNSKFLAGLNIGNIQRPEKKRKKQQRSRQPSE